VLKLFWDTVNVGGNLHQKLDEPLKQIGSEADFSANRFVGQLAEFGEDRGAQLQINLLFPRQFHASTARTVGRENVLKKDIAIEDDLLSRLIH
jgi:hypothetical protein